MDELWIALGGNALVAGGLVFTLIRNGKSQAGKFAALQTTVESTEKTVEATDKKLDTHLTHCANFSGRIDERMLTTEREIRDLEKGK